MSKSHQSSAITLKPKKQGIYFTVLLDKEQFSSFPFTYQALSLSNMVHFMFLFFLPVVGGLRANKSLQELHLPSNQLNSYQDALQLGDLLRYNTTLKILELSNNTVGDAGNIHL